MNNDIPLGTSWDDLYQHLIDNTDRINLKEKDFTGLAAFTCFSKYNDTNENYLNFLSKNDEDAAATNDTSRLTSRKTTKKEKDVVRSLEGGDSNIFNGRGYTLDSRM